MADQVVQQDFIMNLDEAQRRAREIISDSQLEFSSMKIINVLSEFDELLNDRRKMGLSKPATGSLAAVVLQKLISFHHELRDPTSD